MSTFYCDGMTDAIEGRPESPPDPVRLIGGGESDVLRAEYLEGYQSGLRPGIVCVHVTIKEPSHG